MSQRQALAMLADMLKDDTVGLAARTETVLLTALNAPDGNPGPFAVAFDFYRAPLPGVIRPTTRGNVTLTPSRWITNPKAIAGDLREGIPAIQVGFETAGSSHEDNVDLALAVASALVQCLDGLRDYSDAHQSQYGASIIDVAPGIDFSFGDFEGVATYGFLCRFSTTELSNE